MGSSRLPNKILKEIHGEKLIDIVVKECRKTKLDYMVAIPIGDKFLREYIISQEYPIFSGSENDIISRFYHCAKHYEYDPIIRVCADAKMVHSDLILQQLENYKKYGHMIYGNFCEVFSFKQLEWHYLHDKRPETREHVTMGMISDLTVDYEIDLN